MATWDYFTDLIEKIEEQKDITFLLIGLQKSEDDYIIEAHIHDEDLQAKMALFEASEIILGQIAEQISEAVGEEEQKARKEFEIEKKQKIEESLDLLGPKEKKVMLNKLLRDQKAQRAKRKKISNEEKS